MSGRQGTTGRGRTRLALAVPEPANLRLVRHPSVRLDNCIGPFLTWLLHVRRRSENTVSNYGKDVAAFTRFCAELGILRPGQVDFRVIELYMASRQGRGISPKTVNRHVNALRQFWRFLCREGVADKNPAADVFALKEPLTLPKYLTVPEQARVLEALFSNQSLKGRRDLAIVATGLLTGLRVGELARLRMADVDLDAGILRVVNGKGGKDRELPIIPRLETILREYRDKARPAILEWSMGHLRKRAWRTAWTVEWEQEGRRMERTFRARSEIEARERMSEVVPPPPDPYWFFVNVHPNGAHRRKGGPLDKKGIAYVVRERVSPLVGRPVSPHMLRHSFASRLRAAGADLQLIQEALGHESIETTTMYAHLSTTKRKAEIAKYLDGGGEEGAAEEGKP